MSQSPDACFPSRQPPEYSDQERRILLSIAHIAIETALKGQRPQFSPPSEHLSQERGAFTTLHLAGKLRGCIGYVLPTLPLYETVAQSAIAAAFEDPRFYPVTADEAPQLEIEISVLTLPVPIRPEEVEVGTHGLIVSHNRRRGLLLPQVPIEHGWDRDEFLAQTCIKAGLPPDAWQHGATLEAFTAEVFGDSSISR